MDFGPGVALRKESVDRNLLTAGDVTAPSASLSARRAWIEIGNTAAILDNIQSLSARRAWIEIQISKLVFALKDVALRKESVDRNAQRSGYHQAFFRRSPQGERG